ncbi:HAD family hydrolase [Streptomyces albipurpureus]|uniref:HAD family hydrolase n=1 Tax=Streptomyces albipurpureus TaxID=2897419 RepID=A0ABT0V0B2_9ACTN|nr:HAD family hydrolase [Streptomyces sp. CWNU-1]MCM2393008.1 HAD family hydrolase [Streptomyces sp. CWNU-1]
MTIRAVLWDVDDTIFDYYSADRLGIMHHVQAEGLADGYDSADQALCRWQEITAIHWARFSAGEVDWPGQRRDRVRMFTGQAALTDLEADAWFDRYIVHYEAAWTLFPDVVPVLDLLAHYRHGVLSNSSLPVQEHKLRVLGVRDRFEIVICAAELGFSKPEARAFHTACAAMELPPEEVLYVGDHPDIDARGAAEAGLPAVWLDRTGVGGRPELIRITALDQLPALLQGDTRFGAPLSFR